MLDMDGDGGVTKSNTTLKVSIMSHSRWQVKRTKDY